MAAALLALAPLGILGGCGFSDQAFQGAREGLRAAIKENPPPAPPDSTLQGILYGVSALLAYGIGSVGKGYIRGKLEARRDRGA